PSTDSAESARESRVDRDEVDLVARLPQPGAQQLSLDRLASQDVETRRHDRDPHRSTSARLGTSRNAALRRCAPARPRITRAYRRTASRSSDTGTPSATTDATYTAAKVAEAPTRTASGPVPVSSRRAAVATTPASAAAAASLATSRKSARSRHATWTARASITLTATRSTKVTATMATIAPSRQCGA